MHIPTESEANALRYVCSAVVAGYIGGAAIGKAIKDKVQERRRASEDADEDGKIRRAEKRLYELEQTISPDDDYMDKDEWEIIEERNVAILAMRHYRRISQEQHDRAERYKRLYEQGSDERPAGGSAPKINEFRSHLSFWRRPIFLHFPNRKNRHRGNIEEEDLE